MRNEKDCDSIDSTYGQYLRSLITELNPPSPVMDPDVLVQQGEGHYDLMENGEGDEREEKEEKAEDEPSSTGGLSHIPTHTLTNTFESQGENGENGEKAVEGASDLERLLCGVFNDLCAAPKGGSVPSPISGPNGGHLTGSGGHSEGANSNALQTQHTQQKQHTHQQTQQQQGQKGKGKISEAPPISSKAVVDIEGEVRRIDRLCLSVGAALINMTR